MHITTSHNNSYSYSPRTNEITMGKKAEEFYGYSFLPYKPFSSMPNLDMFIIGITEQCNLRCTYCCYSGSYKNNRTHSSLSMSEDDIHALISFIDHYAAKPDINISFYGGEPLTNYTFLQKAVHQMQSHWQDRVSFYIATNGVLLTPERTDWLVSNNVEIGISIDGTKELHDKNRKDVSGKGSFKKVYETLSYISNEYPEFFHEHVFLLMTLPEADNLLTLAESWNNDSLLKGLAPTAITALAPNFEQGVTERTWEELYTRYNHLLDVYEQHRDWIILRTYLEQCIHYWLHRPVMDFGTEVPISTCMPMNRKLYIDAKGNIGVCEKIEDNYRIGNIQEGINWQQANDLALDFYNKRKTRCANCSAIRMCQYCLTSTEFTESQMDTLCHNERLYNRLYFWLFCEMAERGLIQPTDSADLTEKQSEKSENPLVPVTESDVPQLRAIFKDPETRRFLPELCELTKTDEGIRTFLTSFRNYEVTGNGILRGIRVKEKSVESVNPLVGFVAIMDIPDNPTLFYAMHPAYRGQGLMKKAVKDIIEGYKSTFKDINLHTEVYKDNIPSLSILKSVGFKEISESDVKIFLEAT